MVEVQYSGRFGNHMFQYVAGRLLARQLSLPLKTPLPKNDIVETVDQITAYPELEKPLVLVNDNNFALDGRFYTPGHYVLNGYFQRSEFYNERCESIHKMFKLRYPALNKDDIVMHVRLGDYRWAFENKNRVIHPNWYSEILRREHFNNLFIVTENNDDVYLRHFKMYDPIIIHGTAQHDFHFLRQFDRIISSNSSFSWWASFLSRASKVYTFAPWLGLPHVSLAFFDRTIAVDGEFES
jgi:hypothetical protein